MTTITAFARRHPVTAYFALTFAIPGAALFSPLAARAECAGPRLRATPASPTR